MISTILRFLLFLVTFFIKKSYDQFLLENTFFTSLLDDYFLSDFKLIFSAINFYTINFIRNCKTQFMYLHDVFQSILT